MFIMSTENKIESLNFFNLPGLYFVVTGIQFWVTDYLTLPEVSVRVDHDQSYLSSVVDFVEHNFLDVDCILNVL